MTSRLGLVAAVLTLGLAVPAQTWGACRLPFMSAEPPPILSGRPGAVADALTRASKQLIEAVGCINKSVELLDYQLQTERLRNETTESLVQDLKDRLDALERKGGGR
jgi:hypothetical protein